MRILPTAAAVLALCATGCSSEPPTQSRLGTLPIGTAQVQVNGIDVGLTDEVSCIVAGPWTTISIGTAASGLTALVSNGGTLTAKSVAIRNLGGFTGNYAAGLGGTATVVITGRSYGITGRADGFTTSAPAIQTSGTFTVDVAC